MNRTALLLLVPLLAGCDIDAKNPASGDDNVAIKADENGQVSFNVPFASGRVKLPEGAMRGGDFDIDGVKMIPGGTITGFNLDAGHEGGTAHFAFKAPASPQDVRAYFVDEFRKKGLEAAVTGTSVSGKTKDGAPFVIAVDPAPQGSQGTITIQSKD